MLSILSRRCGRATACANCVVDHLARTPSCVCASKKNGYKPRDARSRAVVVDHHLQLTATFGAACGKRHSILADYEQARLTRGFPLLHRRRLITSDYFVYRQVKSEYSTAKCDVRPNSSRSRHIGYDLHRSPPHSPRGLRHMGGETRVIVQHCEHALRRCVNQARGFLMKAEMPRH